MHIKINWPPEMQYWNSDSPRKNAIKTATEFRQLSFWQTGEYPVYKIHLQHRNILYYLRNHAAHALQHSANYRVCECIQ